MNKILIIVFATIGILLSIVGVTMANKKSYQLTQEISEAEQVSPTLTQQQTEAQNQVVTESIAVSTTPTVISATPTPVPVTTLSLSTSDYSNSEPRGSVSGSVITLYDASNKEIGSGVLGREIEPKDGKPGNGAYVSFKVPKGTYSFTADTPTLMGEGSIKIDSLDETIYRSITLTAKPITINGVYYLDENSNNSYDSNEKTFPDKEMYVFYQTELPSRVLEAGKMKTDGKGYFTITLTKKWEGEYIIGAEQVKEYYMTNQPRFQAKGGETHTQNFRLQTNL
jgi:hypothetical protein